MIRLPRFLYSASLNIKHLKKTYSSLNVFIVSGLSRTVFSEPSNSQLHYFSRTRFHPYHKNIASSANTNNLDITFEKISEETLQSLTEFFEELVDSKKELEKGDISYSSGVLNVNLGKYGTYVINRQSPNKQIWLSSPLSGPKRYDYIAADGFWIYKHDMQTLHQLLEKEISAILGETIDMSKCAHS